MIVRAMLALLSIALIALIPHPTSTAADDSTPDAKKIWRTSRNCGVNCLYLYLKIRGHKADYSELLESIPIDSRGTSLIALRDAATRHGSDVALLRATPSEMEGLPKPVIAHMERPEGEGGHFVLVTGLSSGRFEVIDGTTAVRQSINVDEFRRRWSGYVIGPNPVSGSRSAWVVPAIIGAGAVLGLLAMPTHWMARSRPIEEGQTS